MEISTIITGLLTLIGGATVLLRAIAPTTKTLADDNVLKYFEKFLEVVSFDSKAVEGDYLKIKLKDKQ